MCRDASAIQPNLILVKDSDQEGMVGSKTNHK